MFERPIDLRCGLLLALAPLLTATADGSDRDTAGPTDAAGWELVDGVVAQVGDGIVTLSELSQRIDAAIQANRATITTSAEYERAVREALEISVVEELEIQGGSDMNLEPEQVERVIQTMLARRRDEEGAVGLADLLANRDIDARSLPIQQRKGFYQRIWTDAKTGRESLTGERPSLDSYIRPGELFALYEANKANLGEPARYQFQDLVVPVAAVGAPELAQRLIRELRDRALAGEDFGALVNEYGAVNRDTAGVTRWFAAEELAEESLREFAERGSIGAISEPMPVAPNPRAPSEIAGYRILRLHAVRPAVPAPPFDDPEVQRILRRLYTQKRDAARLERARAEERRKSFVWVHPEYVDDEPESPQGGPRAPAQR
jgi:hypothetical protein